MVIKILFWGGAGTQTLHVHMITSDDYGLSVVTAAIVCRECYPFML